MQTGRGECSAIRLEGREAKFPIHGLVDTRGQVHDADGTIRIEGTVRGRLALVRHQEALAIGREAHHVGAVTHLDARDGCAVRRQQVERSAPGLVRRLPHDRHKIAVDRHAVQAFAGVQRDLTRLRWVRKIDHPNAAPCAGDEESARRCVKGGDLRRGAVPDAGRRTADHRKTRRILSGGFGCQDGSKGERQHVRMVPEVRRVCESKIDLPSRPLPANNGSGTP